LKAANAAVELLAPNLAHHPGKVAYFCGERSLSFRELDTASRGFARLLLKEGIKPGERVLIKLPDSLAFPAAFLGCLLAGALAVAISTDTTEEELAYIAEDCGTRLLATHRWLADRRAVINGGIKTIFCGDDALPEDSNSSDDFIAPFQPSAEDLAYMLYSSGATGKPKGVPHRHRSLIQPCDLVGKAMLGITGDDVIFSTGKFSFAYGLINSLAFPLRFGASAVLHPGRPDPCAILDIFERHKPSIFFSVPATYARIVLSQTEPQLHLPMRLCLSAGEALPVPLFEEWRRLTGLDILDGMGSTEMAYHFTCNRPGESVAGSAGRLVPGYRARLVDDNGNDVPAGNDGNLLISGETMSPFYWNLPEKSAETMLPNGYLRTGDICVERNGFFYHRGRSDDLIKTGSHWVSPIVVEEALRTHPAVADCAVAAVSVGNLVKPGAFVVLTPGTEQTPDLAQKLRDHLLARLPAYMFPVRLRFLTELPRTATGKIQRYRLREQAEG
jgi:benzoate-CoA ligase